MPQSEEFDTWSQLQAEAAPLPPGSSPRERRLAGELRAWRALGLVLQAILSWILTFFLMQQLEHSWNSRHWVGLVLLPLAGLLLLMFFVGHGRSAVGRMLVTGSMLFLSLGTAWAVICGVAQLAIVGQLRGFAFMSLLWLVVVALVAAAQGRRYRLEWRAWGQAECARVAADADATDENAARPARAASTLLRIIASIPAPTVAVVILLLVWRESGPGPGFATMVVILAVIAVVLVTLIWWPAGSDGHGRHARLLAAGGTVIWVLAADMTLIGFALGTTEDTLRYGSNQAWVVWICEWLGAGVIWLWVWPLWLLARAELRGLPLPPEEPPEIGSAVEDTGIRSDATGWDEGGRGKK